MPDFPSASRPPRLVRAQTDGADEGHHGSLPYGAPLLLEIWRDKWRLPVFLAISQAPTRTLRHGQLSRRIPDVSHFMLTRALRDLERGGLIARAVFAEVPTRVEYALTERGQEFAAPLLEMEKWSLVHEAELLDVRLRLQRPPRKKRAPEPSSPSEDHLPGDL